MNNNINNEDVPDALGINADKKSDNTKKTKENIPFKMRHISRIKTSQINKDRIAHRLSGHFKKSPNDNDVPDIL